MVIFYILFSTLLPCCFFIRPLKALLTERPFGKSLSNNKYQLMMLFAFMVGFGIRIWNIGTFPMGLNQDEASAGYDAWSILNYGIDRNGFFLPVHLFSWGSGQNALYSYLCMPFIAIFGLTPFSIRLPMALLGCGTLPVIKKLLTKFSTQRFAAVGVLAFALAPWHIMKSRWGLESNLLPDMILIAVLLLSVGIKGKLRHFYTGCAFLGLCAYAYGTSYLFLPLFILLFFGMMIASK